MLNWEVLTSSLAYNEKQGLQGLLPPVTRQLACHQPHRTPLDPKAQPRLTKVVPGVIRSREGSQGEGVSMGWGGGEEFPWEGGGERTAGSWPASWLHSTCDKTSPLKL